MIGINTELRIAADLERQKEQAAIDAAKEAKGA